MRHLWLSEKYSRSSLKDFCKNSQIPFSSITIQCFLFRKVSTSSLEIIFSFRLFIYFYYFFVLSVGCFSSSALCKRISKPFKVMVIRIAKTFVFSGWPGSQTLAIWERFSRAVSPPNLGKSDKVGWTSVSYAPWTPH